MVEIYKIQIRRNNPRTKGYPIYFFPLRFSAPPRLRENFF